MHKTDLKTNNKKILFEKCLKTCWTTSPVDNVKILQAVEPGQFTSTDEAQPQRYLIMIMIVIIGYCQDRGCENHCCIEGGTKDPQPQRYLISMIVDIRVKEVFCFPLLFCLCEEKNFGGSSRKLAASQTGTNICRRNQLLSSVWTLNSLKWNIAFTEPFYITVTVSKLLIQPAREARGPEGPAR